MSATMAVAVPPDAADLGRDLLGAVAVHIRTTTLPPRSREADRRRAADAGAGAGDQADLAVEAHRIPPCQFCRLDRLDDVEAFEFGMAEIEAAILPASLCARRNASDRVQASKSPWLRQIVCDE